MCYDVSYLTRKAEKYAQSHGNVNNWNHVMKKLPPAHHVSGFDEPQLPCITSEHDGIVVLDWPFIPPTLAPSAPDGRPLNTLNARDDRIFSKKSIYYQAAHERRCVVFLDGFFDHHKRNGVAYPFYVELASGDPLMVAGLWQIFRHADIERECVTLVTTQANKEMAWIHNEPAYSPESRMIFVLPNQESKIVWLEGTAEEAQKMIRPLQDGALSYHSCGPIKSNKKLNRVYPGNVPEVKNKVYYQELEQNQGSLF